MKKVVDIYVVRTNGKTTINSLYLRIQAVFMLMWVTNEYYKNVTEILKEYYKWAKRIENNILKGYNWFVLIVK